MDVVHDLSVDTQSLTTQLLSVPSAAGTSHPPAALEGLPCGRSQKEKPRKTLMDRVLVTPMKKHSHSTHRFPVSRSKPPTPSRSLRLRQYSQRASSSHAFAPYPKRSVLPYSTENFPLPKTPNNKLRRTLSDRSYFNGVVAEPSSSASTKARPLMSLRDLTSAPKRSSKRASRFLRSILPPLTGMNPNPSSSAPHTASDSANGALYSSCSKWNPGHSTIIDNTVERKSSAQETDLELEFRTLQLEDDHEQTDASPNLGDCSWSTINDSPQPQQGSLPLDSSLLSVSISESRRERADTLVTRLRNALAAEVHARKQAEHRHLREMKRRIEMEELVTQLQSEREEYSRQLSLAQQPPPSSSPLLLSSSPCASSKVFVASALPVPR